MSRSRSRSRRAPLSSLSSRRAAAGAAVVALVAAGCGGGGDISGETAPAPQGAPEPDATYGGIMPAAQAPPPEGFGTTEIEGIRIDVPDDWETEQADGSLCAHPPEQDTCGYGAFLVFPHTSERQDREWPSKQFDQDKGWAPNPDRCRSAATADGDEKIDDQELTETGFGTHPDPDADDGLRRSHYRVWQVTCKNGDVFEVRLWYLPESDVAAYVWSVDSRYDDVYQQISESMDVTEYLG